MRGGGASVDTSMKLGSFVEAPDVINYAKFHLDLVNSLRASQGSKNGFSLWNAYGSYNIALRYRAGKWLTYASGHDNHTNPVLI